MFERFDEPARRTVFFGRLEASERQSAYIELGDLLVGALRQGPLLKSILLDELALQICEELRKVPPRVGAASPPSVDLPLNPEAKCALTLAAQEAERLEHQTITAGHLILGILEAAKAPTVQPELASILTRAGIDEDGFRKAVIAAQPRGRPKRRGPESLPTQAQSPRLAMPLITLRDSLALAAALSHWTDTEFAMPVAADGSWTRKEALGHLIDFTAAHQQWLAMALAHGEQREVVVPDDSWVAAQHYREADGEALTDLWMCLHRHMMHVIAHIPEEKLAMVSLEARIAVYAEAVLEQVRRIVTGSTGMD